MKRKIIRRLALAALALVYIAAFATMVTEDLGPPPELRMGERQ